MTGEAATAASVEHKCYSLTSMMYYLNMVWCNSLPILTCLVPEKSALGWWLYWQLCPKHSTLTLNFDPDLWPRTLTLTFDLYHDLLYVTNIKIDRYVSNIDLDTNLHLWPRLLTSHTERGRSLLCAKVPVRIGIFLLHILLIKQLFMLFII